MEFNRRSFIVRGFAAGLSFFGLARLVTACSSSSDGGTPTSGGNCATNGTSIAIQVVHTPNHTVTVPTADVVAGTAKTYTLADNGSGHTHTFSLSAANFTSLQNNQGVQVTSTANGHTHTVTVNCA